ncbi:PEP-CTERM sorting domain-containing protein [Geobacter sulfurreducens]|uniref:PEP-CTERM sorting domain-containing protein n=1 Tax=Geobacter sulfurreducens TaxID=35554 RepID=UPI002CE48D09|nr:PEP-CTERM sorting domain-containing protein [Geobacter sulfurreducens]HML79783.1 PEP-CTERM sorting domain-containing protein [Geobacter sulfurreducens]
MKTQHMFILSLLLVMLTVTAAHAVSLSYTYTDKDYLGGASWGSMTAYVEDANTLGIRYTAAPTSVIGAGSTATGFAFTFSGALPIAIYNPSRGAFGDDQDALKWVVFEKKLSTLPPPQNGDEFNPVIDNKYVFEFAATEGDGRSINSTGVKAGQSDIFYMDFNSSAVDFLAFSLADLKSFVELTAVRLMGLPSDINGGSLFLAGKLEDSTPAPVPEPGTILLLGIGIAGLGLYRMKRG